jgi:hypothetical protein
LEKELVIELKLDARLMELIMSNLGDVPMMHVPEEYALVREVAKYLGKDVC